MNHLTMLSGSTDRDRVSPSSTRGSSKDGNKEFSRVELVLVALTIGVLVAIGFPLYLTSVDRAQDASLEETARSGLGIYTKALVEANGDSVLAETIFQREKSSITDDESIQDVELIIELNDVSVSAVGFGGKRITVDSSGAVAP